MARTKIGFIGLMAVLVWGFAGDAPAGAQTTPTPKQLRVQGVNAVSYSAAITNMNVTCASTGCVVGAAGRLTNGPSVYVSCTIAMGSEADALNLRAQIASDKTATLVCVDSGVTGPALTNMHISHPPTSMQSYTVEGGA